MLAKDIHILSEIDANIQSLLEDLNGEIDRRLSIAAASHPHCSIMQALVHEAKLDLDTLDMNICGSTGLSIES